MPNRSLYGRARRDSFFQGWSAESELHAVFSSLSIGNFGNFPKPHSWNFTKYLARFRPQFPTFLEATIGDFLLSKAVLGIFASRRRQV
jgi:hypothetical protein